MCLLSVYSPYALVNAEHLEAGACSNPDGYGFAIIVGDRIEFAHGMDPGATIHAFAAVRARHPESYALFHSRYTTDGVTSEDNCHPFIVGGDNRTVLAHNGILPKAARPKGKDQRSDTRILAESLIPNGHFGRLHRAKGRRSLERWIASEGYRNKVAILTVDPRYRGNAFILGESHGEWVDGVWHSNTDYIPWVPTYTLSRTGAASPDAYGAYMRGEISYAEYLNSKYGIASDLPMCPQCRRTSTVDQVYLFCKDCRICLDCNQHVGECDCWIPMSMRTDVKKEQEAAARNAANVEAALAGLPTDQANRIRDALRDPS